MSIDENNSVSNKKFGLFFGAVFGVLAGYFFVYGDELFSRLFALIALCFLLISFAAPIILTPMNKLWMGLGSLLGRIVSPIILGVIFFGIFSPVAFISKIFSRDELKLRKANSETYWSLNESGESIQKNFINQF
mgnify:CR=1 FL=1